MSFAAINASSRMGGHHGYNVCHGSIWTNSPPAKARKQRSYDSTGLPERPKPKKEKSTDSTSSRGSGFRKQDSTSSEHDTRVRPKLKKEKTQEGSSHEDLNDQTLEGEKADRSDEKKGQKKKSKKSKTTHCIITIVAFTTFGLSFLGSISGIGLV
ncbi:nucleolin 1 [Lingula anatina]|uniref:Nucleolin 1 n=1 Tax=Lingula anatina TaxID=7574 RepID=A0A1S3JGP4_LINAN|nr:nucleolin 1 [Lingula anatina]|eukprot:XP_013409575.1 nucleolin 1 [Lingula anatina]